MTRWLKEPLIHFLLIGGLIFLLYDHLAARGSAPDEIYISRGQQENLLNTFARTWQRMPTPEEYGGLLQDYVRQEIAAREARAMGLDQEDIVIQRRLRQKLELLAEDVASLAAPTDQDLQDYLAANPEAFALEPRLTLRQIYFSRDRRGAAAEQDARTLLEQISGSQSTADFESLGDPLPLPSEIVDMGEGEVARLFGESFVSGLQGLETGAWLGPVESGFGLHLVFIERREAGRVPGLDEVRDEVQREWLSERRRQAVDQLYERLAENYRIEIEPVTDSEPGGEGGQ